MENNEIKKEVNNLSNIYYGEYNTIFDLEHWERYKALVSVLFVFSAIAFVVPISIEFLIVIIRSIYKIILQLPF